MNPTQEQQNAIEMAKSGKSFKMIAFAGAGKTSTLKLIAEALADKKGVYLAFNKSVAQEAQEKMPLNIEARTFHSLAYLNAPNWVKATMRLPRQSYKEICNAIDMPTFKYGFNVPNYHVGYISKEEIAIVRKKGIADKKVRHKNLRFDEKQRPFTISYYNYYKVLELVRACLTHFLQSNATKIGRETIEETLADRLGWPLDIESEDMSLFKRDLYKYTVALWNEHIGMDGQPRTHKPCEFDNFYLKLWQLTNPVINADFIMYDEAQDADPIMIDILQQQMANGTQVIFVGDPHQQIYEWRKAINAMGKLDIDATYLTQSFRFGRIIADTADTILKFMGEKNTLTSGRDDIEDKLDVVNTYEDVGEWVLDVITKQVDAILCRYNSTALDVSLALHSKGENFNLNIDKKAIKELMYAFKELKDGKMGYGKSITGETRTPLHMIFRTREINDWQDMLDHADNMPKDSEILVPFRIFDNYPFSSIIKVLDYEPDTTLKTIEVSTVHKAKGLEWDNVAIAPDLRATMDELSEMITVAYKLESTLQRLNTPQQANDVLKKMLATDQDDTQLTLENILNRQEEFRIFYVALTRAKQRLIVDKTTVGIVKFFNEVANQGITLPSIEQRYRQKG